MYENSVVVAPKKEFAGYSAWRSTFQSSEAAAKSAYDDASSLHDDVLVLEQARKQDQDKIEALEADISELKRKALIISKANEQLAEQCKESDALKARHLKLCQLVTDGFEGAVSYEGWKSELKALLSECNIANKEASDAE
jgi:hypothetical protein